MASTLFLTADVARSLGLLWIMAWLSIGGAVQVREMPAKQPAMFMDDRQSTTTRRD